VRSRCHEKENTISHICPCEDRELIPASKIYSDMRKENNIYHQCECGNTDIDIFSVVEVLHHAQEIDIPSVEINYICPACGSMMTESAYLYKRKDGKLHEMGDQK